MSDIQSIMKFELLPNEILIECLEYLHAIDMFNAFNLLNSRFYHLIRSIPLHLNSVDTDQRILVKFCTTVKSNSQIKHQIKSLKMSNTFRSNKLLSSLMFDCKSEFSELQSLTLTNLDKITADTITCALKYLTNLRYFRLDHSSCPYNELLSTLSTLDIRTLSIPRIDENLKRFYPFKSLVSLTISVYFNGEFHALFKCLPKIRYLHLRNISRFVRPSSGGRFPANDNGISLKRLIIDGFDNEFALLEILLRLTPNLKLLIISTINNEHIVDAPRWQQLLTSLLPQLDVFKFKFGFKMQFKDTNIIERYQEFQTEFWHQQHCWYIECTINLNKVLFYTAPYLSNEYEISQYSTRLYNKSFNNLNTYINVTDLKLCPKEIMKNNGYYFPNVKLLNVYQTYLNNSDFLTVKHVSCLKTIVNLSGVTHLDLSQNYESKSSLALSLVLKEASHVSFLNIYKNILYSWLDDCEFCERSNKTMTELIVTEGYRSYAPLNFDQMVKVCQIFPNMEKLCCQAWERSDLEMILRQLSRLSHMKVFSYQTKYFKNGRGWLEDHAQELKSSYSFSIKCVNTTYDPAPHNVKRLKTK